MENEVKKERLKVEKQNIKTTILVCGVNHTLSPSGIEIYTLNIKLLFVTHMHSVTTGAYLSTRASFRVQIVDISEGLSLMLDANCGRLVLMANLVNLKHTT